jgi:uncharacterized protein (TIGR02246 family)
MRTAFAIGIWLLAAFQSPARPASGGAADESVIRGVVKSYLDARERRDDATLRGLFTEDADQLTSSGEWRKGREAIVSGTLASSQRTTGTRRINIETIRFPTTGVAIADGRYEIAGPSEDANRRMWTTFVLVRQGKEWRISGIRNMLPAPA